MYQGLGHYPVNPPDFSSKGKSRKHIVEEFRAECGKLSNPGLWARWRGPLGGKRFNRTDQNTYKLLNTTFYNGQSQRSGAVVSENARCRHVRENFRERSIA